jgi:hypothetical protein
VRSNYDPQSLAAHLGDSLAVVLSTYVHSTHEKSANAGALVESAGLVLVGTEEVAA